MTKYTTLHDAAISGTPADIRALIDAGHDIEVRNDDGDTPLHSAAAKGTPDNIRALLDAGANIEAHSSLKFTPLHKAAGGGGIRSLLCAEDPYAIRLLLDRGADINARHPDNIRILIEAGANIEARAKTGHTPLHIAASYGTHAEIRALLDAGADPSVRHENGGTPLDMAERREDGDAVPAEILRDAGAKPDCQ